MLYIGFWFTNLIWDISSEMRRFPPYPSPRPFCVSTNFTVHRPHLLVKCPQAPPPLGHAQVPTCVSGHGACSHLATWMCTCPHSGSCRPGAEGAERASSVGPPSFEAENGRGGWMTESHGGTESTQIWTLWGCSLHSLLFLRPQLASWQTRKEYGKKQVLK